MGKFENVHKGWARIKICIKPSSSSKLLIHIYVPVGSQIS